MWQDEARQALADAQAQLKEAGVLAKRAGDEALQQAEAAREAEEARKKAVGSFEVNWAALCDTQEKLAAAEARVVSLEELVRASESAGENAPAGDTAAEVQALQAQLAQAVKTYEAQLIKQGERLAALQCLEQEVAELRSGRGGASRATSSQRRCRGPRMLHEGFGVIVRTNSCPRRELMLGEL